VNLKNLPSDIVGPFVDIYVSLAVA
jgi:hypothetical protein